MLEGVVTWAEIDLDAIAANVDLFKRFVGKSVEVIAVVKANAYGHGAVIIAGVALANGATRLAVHRVVEGIELRKAGIEVPILIMGYLPPDGAKLAVEWRLTPSIITIETAEALSEESIRQDKKTSVHVKLDSGMNRYGVMPDEVMNYIYNVSKFPGIGVEGIFTHFATADSADQTHVNRQLEIFINVLTTLHRNGFEIPLVHAANSAAIMKLPKSYFNAVRLGIAMYGMKPSDEWQPVFDLNPALTLKSRVSRVRELPPDSGISYGRTFVTQRITKAALIPVGYGDGYHRSLSNKGCVLIRGERAPILGRVCMDQFIVDVSHIPGVAIEDEVVLIGKQNENWITADEVAKWAGTINYEISTSLLPRVVRIYRQGGRLFFPR